MCQVLCCVVLLRCWPLAVQNITIACSSALSGNHSSSAVCSPSRSWRSTEETALRLQMPIIFLKAQRQHGTAVSSNLLLVMARGKK